MASTHTPKEAIDYAKRFVYREPADDADIVDVILNAAADELYFAKAWPWSVGQLTTITLANDTDDYTITDPTDFLYLLHAEVLHPSGEVELLQPVGSMPPEDTIKGIPRYIARTSATNLRVKPLPTGIPSGSEPSVISWYKKTTTRIITNTNDTTAATLPFPDEWFTVYAELVLYYAMKFAQDPRAGSMQPARQGVSLPTGQLARALDLLETMKAAEPGLTIFHSGGESGRSR